MRLSQMALVGSIVCWMLVFSGAIVDAQENEDRQPISIYSVAWSPDGTRIAVGRGTDVCDPLNTTPYTIQILDAATSQVVQNLTGSTCSVTSVDWSPDGSRVAAASNDGIGIRVWNASNGQLLATNQTVGEASISVRWHPDGTRLATTDSGGGILVLDATSGQMLSVAPIVGAFIDWNADGSRLVSGSGLENQLRVADMSSGQQLMVITGGQGSADWSPEGSRIASSALDDTARIWDAETGEALLTLQGHTGLVTEVAWSPDSSRVASSSSDGTVRIWDATTGEQLEVIEYSGRVYAVDWSPDGSRLAYGGYRNDGQDATIEIVELPASLSGIPTLTATPTE